LLDIEQDHVRFAYKDYRADPSHAQKTMTLAAEEFIRRFLLHVLPIGFHRIRYYGFLGARHRRHKLARCRELLGSPAPISTPPDTAPPDRATAATDYRDKAEALTGVSLRVCPVCHHGQMIVIELLRPTHMAVLIPDTS
jgi:putative transposase